MRQRGAAALLLGAVLAPSLAGCGIRATEVPTYFGPAPSRMPCAASASSPGPSDDSEVPVRVYLLCAGQLTLVERTVRLPEGTDGSLRRTLVAQGLLDELTRHPSPGEQQNGYRTKVPSGTGVKGPRSGDPADAFRLSDSPQRLPAGALAQIVCTFAESAATRGSGRVTLGGPQGPLTRYECPQPVRTHPITTPVPSDAPATAE
ncbi:MULTISPECIES: hypothetical protein [Streptomyces]|uniref:Lipoprotein n=1 Tax=Streptomyces chilikensis TaxID=1194079 RepID=A0ABV3EWX6_9ACTN|nr:MULTISPECIES: hypothetical protein [Streptomyces]MDH6225369.1 hypothetical protein [Streptomyces sp. MJP52]